MNKRDISVIATLTIVLLITNFLVFYRQTDFRDLQTQPPLDTSKEFANQLVENMRSLAAQLEVEERTPVKHALAKLHYDVYLASSRTELARIVQHEAAYVRSSIVSEYVKSTSDQVLTILNSATEIHAVSAKTVLTIEPLPTGGMSAREPNRLATETKEQLAQLTSLFSFDYFRNLFDDFRTDSILAIEVEDGVARLIQAQSDQESAAFWERELQSLRAEYTRTSQLAGYGELTGPGIVFKITPLRTLEPDDLRMLVGEILDGGAQGITVDGHRLTATSYIVGADNGIIVNGAQIRTSPLVVQAIGDYDTISTAVFLLFNNIWLASDFHIETEPREKLTLPAKTLR